MPLLLERLGLYSRSRLSKGFVTRQAFQDSGCSDIYARALELFIQALKVPVFHQVIHAGANGSTAAAQVTAAGVRQFLHRMVICMAEDLLPYVPTAVSELINVERCMVRSTTAIALGSIVTGCSPWTWRSLFRSSTSSSPSSSKPLRRS